MKKKTRVVSVFSFDVLIIIQQQQQQQAPSAAFKIVCVDISYR